MNTQKSQHQSYINQTRTKISILQRNCTEESVNVTTRSYDRENKENAKYLEFYIPHFVPLLWDLHPATGHKLILRIRGSQKDERLACLPRG